MRTPDISRQHYLTLVRLIGALGLISLLCGALLTLAPIAIADTIGVTTTADGGPGSLRAAITLANASPGPHQIILAPGNYQLTIAPTGVDDNTSGDLNVITETSISSTGGAAVTSIESTVADRVITATADLTLSGLTVENGDVGSGSGGNIRNGDNWTSPTLTLINSVVSGGHAIYGGGILASGTLVMQGTTIKDNSADPISGSGAIGGGVYVQGEASITDSTFVNNDANGGHGGGMVIAPSKAGMREVSNSTFVGNSAYAGGAISVINGFAATLTHLTIVGNAATPENHGAGIWVQNTNSLATVRNSVILGNLGAASAPSNCGTAFAGTIASSGGNLSDDTSCSMFTQPGDTVSDSGAALGALVDNGGSTRTMLPSAGSTAIDTATCDPSVSLDQRGLARPSGVKCDKGAVEVQSDTTPTTVTQVTTTGPSTTVAPTTTVGPTTTVASSTTVAPSTTLVEPPGTTAPSTTLVEPPGTTAPSTTLVEPPTSDPGTTSSTPVAAMSSTTSTDLLALNSSPTTTAATTTAGEPQMLAATGTNSSGKMLIGTGLLGSGLILVATSVIIEARRRTQASI